MRPIKDYQFAPISREPPQFSRGFSLAVVIILTFVAMIIGCLVMSFHTTIFVANARLVYLAASAKAIEFEAAGTYRVPDQADLLSLIGEEVNKDAVIEVADENRDATIDYIVYIKKGISTKYSPGETVITHINDFGSQ